MTAVFEGGTPVDSPIALFLVQLMLITLVSRTLGFFLKKIKQPMVVAEMIAGIVLGPSVLGNIPGFTESVFPTVSLRVLNVFAQFGLILYMFLVGIEMDLVEIRQSSFRAVFISSVGVLVPLLAAIPGALLFADSEFTSANFWVFVLFFGLVLGISALPVLARILAERDLLGSKLGVMIMSATAVDDLISWPLLALVTSLATAAEPLNALWAIIAVALNVLVMIFIVRRGLYKAVSMAEDPESVPPWVFYAIFFLVFFVGWITEMIGINAIFGAFQVGIAIPRRPAFVQALVAKIEDLVVVVLLPLYFTFSGLRTEFALLNDARLWGLSIFVIALAFAAKIFGIFLPAKLAGLTVRESFSFGILMSTKGLVALIALNMGLDYDVITQRFFTICVLMVLATTFATTPLINCVYPPLKRIQQERRLRSDSMVRQAVILIDNASESMSLLSLVKLVMRSNASKVSAVRVFPVGENPSEFMGARDVGRDRVFRVCKDRAALLDIKLSGQGFLYADNTDEIVQHVNGLSPRLVYSHWNPAEPAPILQDVVRQGMSVLAMTCAQNCPVVIHSVLVIAHATQNSVIRTACNSKQADVDVSLLILEDLETGSLVEVAATKSGLNLIAANGSVEERIAAAFARANSDHYDLVVFQLTENDLCPSTRSDEAKYFISHISQTEGAVAVLFPFAGASATASMREFPLSVPEIAVDQESPVDAAGAVSLNGVVVDQPGDSGDSRESGDSGDSGDSGSHSSASHEVSVPLAQA